MAKFKLKRPRNCEAFDRNGQSGSAGDHRHGDVGCHVGVYHNVQREFANRLQRAIRHPGERLVYGEAGRLERFGDIGIAHRPEQTTVPEPFSRLSITGAPGRRLIAGGRSDGSRT